MKTPSIAVLAATFIWTALTPAHAAELKWLTDLPQAQARAKGEGKCVLLFFHGSDWCPSCVQMQRQVFDAPAFQDFAGRALILVDVDFPEKQPQAESLRVANQALKAKFNLSAAPGEGLPTIVLLNEAGQTVFQETGYSGGGSAELMPKLEKHVATKTTAAGTITIKNLSVEEFARMAADKQNVILDVRTAREFDAGHLAGAINLDVLSADFATKATTLDQNKAYLVHCASGVRSATACDKLAKLGFQKLYNLPVGYRGWVKAGQPTEK
jgi:rhodanese-related sulfurtransferase/thioredoxin-related protein